MYTWIAIIALLILSTFAAKASKTDATDLKAAPTAKATKTPPPTADNKDQKKAIQPSLVSSPFLSSWGRNDFGQLGDGTTTASIIPVTVDTSGVLNGKSIVAISAGNLHSLVLTTDGSVYSWGLNYNGRLGDGKTDNSRIPVAVDTSGVLNGKKIVAISAGNAHSLALSSDGNVYAWGSNVYGQLGDGTTTDSSVPVAVTTSGALSGKLINAIAAGFSSSLVLSSDGKVYAWGNNLYGQLGNGLTTTSVVPVAVDTSGVLNGKIITAIAAREYHSAAISSDGQVYSWGLNNFGQLGDGTTTDSPVPVAVNTNGVLNGKTIVAIALGNAHTLALSSDGNIYSWGLNFGGRLGDGTTTDSLVPVAVDMSGVLSGKTITAIAAGDTYSLALSSDGKVYSWGYNTGGRLGDGTIADSPVPVAVNTNGVLSGKTVISIAAGYLLSFALFNS